MPGLCGNATATNFTSGQRMNQTSTGFNLGSKPFRGTLFKNPDGNTNIWWNEGVGPHFGEQTTVFSFRSTGSNTLSKEPARISSGAIDRLLCRPEHKKARRKFDGTSPICLEEKNNNIQTKEDNYDPNDVPWIMSLRPLETESQAKGKLEGGNSKNLNMEDAGSEAGNRKDDVIANPPAFFEDDLSKWSKKFKGANDER